jgi:hypothetical protein
MGNRTNRLEDFMARTTTRRSTKTRKTPAAKRAPVKARTKRALATPSGTSDKDHLISVIREKTGCNKQVAKETLDALIGTVTASLKKNQKVQLVGFGTVADGHDTQSLQQEFGS